MVLEYSFEIKQLIFFVHLGITKLERSISQKISLDLKVLFKQTDWSMDDLTKKICYDTLITGLSKFLAQNEYNSVEYLTEQVYFFLKNYMLNALELDLAITKLNPPLQNKNGGMRFRIKGVL